jgi:signal recognition particle receptor subunit beta
MAPTPGSTADELEVHDFKVVVAGPFAAGKTTLIAAISDTPVVGTEQPTSGLEAAVKATTTVGMEYGTYTVADGDLVVNLSLYGVPGQERFSFMWDIVAEGLDGLVLLVDATKPDTWADAAAVGRHFARHRGCPVVVGVNRTDDATVTADVARRLDLGPVSHLPCDPTDASSARELLVELLLLVLEEFDDEAPLGDLAV